MVVFVVGGGGHGGSSGSFAGPSGYFRYRTFDITEDNTRVIIKLLEQGKESWLQNGRCGGYCKKTTNHPLPPLPYTSVYGA